MDIFGIVFARKKTLKKQREELLNLIHDFYFYTEDKRLNTPNFYLTRRRAKEIIDREGKHATLPYWLKRKNLLQ